MNAETRQFWNTKAMVEDHWLRCLHELNDTVQWQEERSRRLSFLELTLQTPFLTADRFGRWFALLSFRGATSKALFFVPPECYREAAPEKEYGYAAESVFEKALEFVYDEEETTIAREKVEDLVYLWTLQAEEENLSPVLAAQFDRLTSGSLPDDRLILEWWSPGVHPAVARGLQNLHLLVKTLARDYQACIEALATFPVKCGNESQDALVMQCRCCIRETTTRRSFDRAAFRLVSRTFSWQFACKSVPLSFSDGNVRYETTYHRMRWLAVWAQSLVTFEARAVLLRTPDCMVTAFARRKSSF